MTRAELPAGSLGVAPNPFESQTVDRVIIVARENWGNTDFVEFAEAAARSGVKVHFVGYPPTRSARYVPEILSPEPGLNPLSFCFQAAALVQKLVQTHAEDVIALHIRYFKSCSILRRKCSRRAILDIRSGSVRPSTPVRRLDNLVMALEARLFDRVTMVSDPVGKSLGIKQFTVLPLGARKELLAIERTPPLNTSKLKFVYIGTLVARNIDQFAEAFEQYLCSSEQGWQLDIFGYGSQKDCQKMLEITKRCNRIRFHGPVGGDRVPDVLKNADVGVSYIPLTRGFDLQPPTKTYEYLLAGLPTLATRTTANKGILNDAWGWLCNDTASSVQKSLGQIEQTFADKWVDRNSFYEHTWEAIFARDYRPTVLERSYWAKDNS